jgi:hypothetical protein
MSDEWTYMRIPTKQFINMAIALVITLVLLVIEYTNIKDEVFRRQLIEITGGCGLIASIFFGLRAAWSSYDARSEEGRQSTLKSVRNLILVSLGTGYAGLGAVINAIQAWQKGGAPSTADMAIVLMLSAVAIYGSIILTRMVISLRRKKLNG